MNIEESRKAIKEACDAWLAQGGKIEAGMFGLAATKLPWKPQCRCALGCYLGSVGFNPAFSFSEQAATKLEWTIGQTWSFVCGFDATSLEVSEVPEEQPSEEHYKLGQEFRSMYIRESEDVG